ncbi:MAG TPA: Hsp20/alpha crystallin family protein [Prochlorococcaceae cyanobacterium Fu_MAG_50]|nr:Hsp20/alpha crystallin family protein [Prochlorococcaceae cyanobacterium Fu_MAG_50]
MLTLRQSPFDLFNQLEQQLASAERIPAAEIVEQDDAYTARLELPGVDKSSIEIKATDRTLVVTAERTNPANSHPANSHPDDNTSTNSTSTNSTSTHNHVTTVAEPNSAKEVNAQQQLNQPLLSEFRYGTWSRSFRFPQALDRDQLKAVYRDGILEITAGKIPTQTTVSVEVES